MNCCEIPGGLKVCDANGQSLAYVYSRENPNDAHMAKVLTEDEARRIAANIAKLPDAQQSQMKPLEEKQKHLDHLHYEVTMLHYCLPEIAKREPGKDRNVYIECFALHERALYEFLISNSPRKLNVVAKDFVADFQPTDSESVGDIIKKIQDQILHIGWERTQDNSLKFDAATEGEQIFKWIAFWQTVFWTRLP